jgi:hypothetical protein
LNIDENITLSIDKKIRTIYDKLNDLLKKLKELQDNACTPPQPPDPRTPAKNCGPSDQGENPAGNACPPGIPVVPPQDPNSKSGPAGFGAQAFIPGSAVLPYRIDFENDPTAKAPAQRVVVTDQLDSNLDWSTLQFTEVGFGDTVIAILAGSQHFQTSVAMTENGQTFQVEIELGLNVQTGKITVTFQSIDPNTKLPPDVLTGFLPPEDGTGRGMGYFSYTLLAKTGLPTGTQIHNVASVIFNENPPITTDQVNDDDPSQGVDPARQNLNTIDSGAPTTSVDPLPAITHSSRFTVSWSGQDDPGGSGIITYDVFVSDNGRPFTLWQADTTDTSASFTGVDGHSYGFYSRAFDNVNNHEAAKTAAEATAQVVLQQPTGLSAVAGQADFAGDLTLTATLSSTSGGTPLASEPVTFTITTNAGTSSFGPVSTSAQGVATIVVALPAGIGAGTYTGAVTASFAGDTSNQGTTGSGDLTVAQAAPVITWANPSAIASGTPLGSTQLDASASTAGTFSYSPVAGTVLNAGLGQSLMVSFTPTDSADYTSATTSVSIDVLPAQPAFSLLASPTITYGTANVTLSGTLTAPTAIPAGGGVSITLGNVTQTATIGSDGSFSSVFDTHALGASPTAYPISYSLTATTNFAAASGSGSLTVNKATLTVTADNQTRTYGGPDPVYTASYSGFQNGETFATSGVTGMPSLTSTDMASSPVGVYTITAAAGTLAASNYTFAFVNGTLTITQAHLAVVADDQPKTYDGTVFTAFTAHYTGFLNGEDSSVILGAAGFSGAAVTAVNAGSDTITPTIGTLSATNYDFTAFVNGTLTINQRLASVTPDPASKTYGDPDPTLTGTLTNFVASDGVTATYSRTAGETVLGGPYTISATLSPSSVLSNYAITYNTANFTITAKSASVTPNAASKTYGDGDPTLTGTLSGFLPADGVTATYTRTAGEAVLGGPYTINATLSPSGVLSNYSITYNTASFTIGTRAASVTPTPASKTYGMSDPTFSGTLSGFLSADGVTATYSRTAGETVLGGPYTISATLSPSGVLSNYAITYNTASFTIGTKAASVTPNAASKTYGASDATLTGTLTGFLTADGVTATYSRTAGETVLGGPYTISATLNPSSVLSNYAITYNTASFTITTKAASVTPNAASKTYGDADPTLTGSLSGFLPADGVTATHSRAAGETVLGGPYTISATLSPIGVLSNYAVTYNTASFTIGSKAAAVKPNAASKTYGASDPTLTGTLTGFLTADGVSASYSRTAGETVLGGPYTISATLSPSGVLSNYAITYNTASFTIGTRAASVTPNAARKTYGDADPTLTGVFSGFLPADGVTASYSRTAGETLLGGPYTISATLSPSAVLSNYSITYNTASFTIGIKSASVTPNPASKTYGDPDPTLTGVLSGFLAADGVTATYGRMAGETVLGGPYTISATLSPSGVLSNYSITYNTSSFTIATKAASVTPNAASKTYGASDPTLSGTLSGFLAADGVTATYSRTAGEIVLGGPYTISAILSPSNVLSNYTITYNTSSFTITAKSASVTPNAAGKTYGNADPALTGSLSGFLAGDGVTATYSRTAGETVLGGPYTINATLSPGNVLSNYAITYNTARFTIGTKAASVTPNPASKTYGASDPTLTGTLTGFLTADGVTATYSRTAGEMVLGGPYTISATLSPSAVLSNYAITYNTANFTINPAPLTVTANDASKVSGSPNPPFTARYSGFVNGDTPSSLGGTLTFTTTATTSSPVGTYPITSGGLTSSNYTITFVPGTLTITPSSTITPGSIYVLDPTAGGALTLSGSASINTSGPVVVDSSASTAILASGSARVSAASVLVVGGVSNTGTGSVTKTGTPATTADPLAGLAEPTVPYSGTATPEDLGNGAIATIKQGLYSQINVSGNAQLTLSPGTYVIAGGGVTVSGSGVLNATNVTFIIEGGGFTESGSATVNGSGVTIFNAGSKYPATGGSYGAITLSGGTGNLSAPTSGSYAGILIFQPRDNSQTLNFSNNTLPAITGTIYASGAQLVESGTAQIGSASNPVSIIVDRMKLSFNAIADGLTLDAPTGTIAYTPAQVRSAYSINNLSEDGTGQTIAIVDAYNDPSLDQALDTFDNQFGFLAAGPTLYQQYGPAAAFLTVLNQAGQSTSLPATDPAGANGDNWELEEALDVEWAHAIAPGARIVVVEASSPLLADLMASVATAAQQPGVSVVSMSWGFAEGQSVLGSDEAAYDNTLTAPGVTFVASTGDYGAADPQFPAYSPNVVAVGGTSLALNADSSYQGETGWGYVSTALGSFIGSGGGLSRYEPEPAYQQGVQATGNRTTPDVALVADPTTGAWIADPYNLPGDDPFEVVGGTSLSAPAWAGLMALVNQGRAAAGEAALNSSSPTEVQQALYKLPQSDYNTISTGFNGYSAGTGYNLVTGLGTPVANRLVSDLVAYQGPATSYPGPTVGPLQAASLVSTGAGGGGPFAVFSVFDALAIAPNEVGFGPSPGRAIGQSWSALLPASVGAGSVAAPSFLVSATGAGAPVSPRELASAAPTQGAITSQPLALAATAALPPSSLTLAAAAVPSVRIPSGFAGTPSHRGQLVPSLTGPSAGQGARSWLGPHVGDEDPLPALLRVNDHGEPRAWVPSGGADAVTIVPVSPLGSWDDALLAYVAESDERTGPSSAADDERESTDRVEAPTASALESLLMPGVAVASWGAWELHSQIGDRSRRRLSLGSTSRGKTSGR